MAECELGAVATIFLSLANHVLTSFWFIPRVLAIRLRLGCLGYALFLTVLYHCSSWPYSSRVGNGGAIAQFVARCIWN